MTTLAILASAYRCNLEEQDDPALWITAALRGAGCQADVLLRHDAVNYAVRGQDAGGLVLGRRRQTHPPDIAADLTRLLGQGAAVSLVREDLDARGITPDELIDGVEVVGQDALPELFEAHEHIWHW